MITATAIKIAITFVVIAAAVPLGIWAYGEYWPEDDPLEIDNRTVARSPDTTAPIPRNLSTCNTARGLFMTSYEVSFGSYEGGSGTGCFYEDLDYCYSGGSGCRQHIRPARWTADGWRKH